MAARPGVSDQQFAAVLDELLHTEGGDAVSNSRSLGAVDSHGTTSAMLASMAGRGDVLAALLQSIDVDETNDSQAAISKKGHTALSLAAFRYPSQDHVNCFRAVLEHAAALALAEEEAARLSVEEEVAEVDHVWEGIRCDGCEAEPLCGARFMKQLQNDSFDLCAACFAKLSDPEQAEFQPVEPEQFVSMHAFSRAGISIPCAVDYPCVDHKTLDGSCDACKQRCTIAEAIVCRLPPPAAMLLLQDIQKHPGAVQCLAQDLSDRDDMKWNRDRMEIVQALIHDPVLSPSVMGKGFGFVKVVLSELSVEEANDVIQTLKDLPDVFKTFAAGLESELASMWEQRVGTAIINPLLQTPELHMSLIRSFCAQDSSAAGMLLWDLPEVTAIQILQLIPEHDADNFIKVSAFSQLIDVDHMRQRCGVICAAMKHRNIAHGFVQSKVQWSSNSSFMHIIYEHKEGCAHQHAEVVIRILSAVARHKEAVDSCLLDLDSVFEGRIKLAPQILLHMLEMPAFAPTVAAGLIKNPQKITSLVQAVSVPVMKRLWMTLSKSGSCTLAFAAVSVITAVASNSTGGGMFGAAAAPASGGMFGGGVPGNYILECPDLTFAMLEMPDLCPVVCMKLSSCYALVHKLLLRAVEAPIVNTKAVRTLLTHCGLDSVVRPSNAAEFGGVQKSGSPIIAHVLFTLLGATHARDKFRRWCTDGENELETISNDGLRCRYQALQCLETHEHVSPEELRWNSSNVDPMISPILQPTGLHGNVVLSILRDYLGRVDLMRVGMCSRSCLGVVLPLIVDKFRLVWDLLMELISQGDHPNKMSWFYETMPSLSRQTFQQKVLYKLIHESLQSALCQCERPQRVMFGHSSSANSPHLKFGQHKVMIRDGEDPGTQALEYLLPEFAPIHALVLFESEADKPLLKPVLEMAEATQHPHPVSCKIPWKLQWHLSKTVTHRYYGNDSRDCYECGQHGHLSYECGDYPREVQKTTHETCEYHLLDFDLMDLALTKDDTTLTAQTLLDFGTPATSQHLALRRSNISSKMCRVLACDFHGKCSMGSPLRCDACEDHFQKARAAVPASSARVKVESAGS